MSPEFLNFILDCSWLIQLALVLGLKDRELARHRQTPGFDPKHRKKEHSKSQCQNTAPPSTLALRLINVLILMDFQ